jgi:hypothetical protein
MKNKVAPPLPPEVDAGKRKILLAAAVGDGEYPPGTTAQDLADVRMPVMETMIDVNGAQYADSQGGETVLHYAAEFGHLPAGTTAAVLASVKDAHGTTPLHLALSNHHLPQEIRAADLSALSRQDGYTELHVAATYGCYPSDTTVEALINTICDNGWSALHEAAGRVNLLPKTTVRDLVTTRRTDGRSALDCLSDRILEIDELEAGIAKRILEQVPQLILASRQTEGPNVCSQEQLHEVGAILGRIVRVQTVEWMAIELLKLPIINVKHPVKKPH